MSGKFELASGKCQGILFCQVCMNPAIYDLSNGLRFEMAILKSPSKKLNMCIIVYIMQKQVTKANIFWVFCISMLCIAESCNIQENE